MKQPRPITIRKAKIIATEIIKHQQSEERRETKRKRKSKSKGKGNSSFNRIFYSKAFVMETSLDASFKFKQGVFVSLSYSLELLRGRSKNNYDHLHLQEYSVPHLRMID